MPESVRVVVNRFGGPEVLEVASEPVPAPGAGQVLVRLTSIGMNHAELMGRRGDYKLTTGEPPFTPGLEGGGVIEAVGGGVDAARVGARVTLTPDVTRTPGNGSYRSHMVVDDTQALDAPRELPDEQLGAVWLPYLTAWGCLVWKQDLREGQVVALPAASSSVALAAAQIARHLGARAIGLTTSPAKVEAIRDDFDDVIVTHEGDTMKPWHKDVRELISDRGVDVFMDPVAAGDYLTTELKCLAMDGTVWLYGHLGEPGVVEFGPLLWKRGAIRAWVLWELVKAGRDAWLPGCQWILDRLADGEFKLRVARTFALNDVRRAHEVMEKGDHVGKLVLVP